MQTCRKVRGKTCQIWENPSDIATSLMNPYLINCILVDQTELLAERLVQDVLVGDGDDVAHELSDAVLEAGHAPHQVSHGVNLSIQ